MKNWCFWTVVLEKTLESPLDCKESQLVHPKGLSVLSVHWKDWCWSWNSNTSATWCEELTHLKRPWCWERLKAGGEGDDRGWDGWMASPTQWTWVWVDSGSWWWTGRPRVLRFVGSQRVGHAWATELNWIYDVWLKTMSSCPGLTPMLHSTIGLTAGPEERSPLRQWLPVVYIPTSRKRLSPSLWIPLTTITCNASSSSDDIYQP